MQRFAKRISQMNVIIVAALALSGSAPVFAAEFDNVVARVGDDEITDGHVELQFLIGNVPSAAREQLRPRFIETLIQRRLVNRFFAVRGTKPVARRLQARYDRITELLQSRGKEPRDEFARIGLDSAAVREQLATQVLWQTYLEQILTDRRIRSHFDKHKAEFDGTRLRARQVFVKVVSENEADWEPAIEHLNRLREEITAGKLTFDDAARQFSDAPTGRKGGDVGFFRYRGRLPQPVAAAAFALKDGEISQPIRSAFGLHLVQVTDRKPGDLSLEDARRDVTDQLSRQLWNDAVAKQRSQVTVILQTSGR